MSRFEHLLFVCTNSRDANHKLGSCQAEGGEELLNRLKELTVEHKLKGKVRVTRSGCLDFCAKGCAVLALSKDGPARETWYTNVAPADADELFKSHVLNNQVLERLED